MRSLHLPFFWIEIFKVCCVYLEIRPCEPIVLFADVNFILNRIFFEEVLLINSILSQVRLNRMELAEMPAASTIRANTKIRVMMAEIQILELARCFGKILVKLAFFIALKERLRGVLMFRTSINFTFCLIFNIHGRAIVSS